MNSEMCAEKKVGVNKSWQWQNDLSDQTRDYQMPAEIITTCDSTLENIKKQISKPANEQKVSFF